MQRVRFAPSPTGSLHVGNALSAVANRRLGDWMLLRIDDTDPARNLPGGEEEIVRDLTWLGVEWNEGPIRQSARGDRHRDVGAKLGEDGKKLAKRAPGATVASLREAGIPGPAVHRYLEELGVPQHDVHYNLPRIRRLAIETIESMSDEELAAAADAPLQVAPALRGARDLNEAREYARAIMTAPAPVKVDAAETLERFRELVERTNGGPDPRSDRLGQ